MNEPVAFLNGRWIAQSAAAVSVGDAGLVLGAAVAERLRTFAGRIFRLQEHLDRLAESLAIVGLDPGMTPDQLAQTACELAARNHPLLPPDDDLGLSIFVTPGVMPNCAAPGGSPTTVCMHTYRLPFHLWAEKYRRGQALATTAVEQVSPHCWPARLKCRSRMHYYLADRQAAAAHPRACALLLDVHGFVTETSTANVLIYNADSGLASPPQAKILPGISLATTLELAGQLGVTCVQRELTAADVAAADEVFLTSTPTCILAATSFNGRPIGAGRPGVLFQRLIAAWSDLTGVDIIGQAVRQGG